MSEPERRSGNAPTVRSRVPVLRGIGTGFLVLIGLYLVVRAALQPFVIDTSDPATYAEAWGGPSLAGVMIVHMLPGVVALVLLVRFVLRHRQAARHRTP